MCGRYTQVRSWSELVELYRITETARPLNIPARYNTNAQATELAQKIQFKTDEDRDKFTILYDWEFLNDQIEPSIARFEKEILPLAK